MPISDNSRAFLEEMRKNGVDPTILAGLERDLDSKPNAEKAVSNGILAQTSFNSYRSKKDQEIKDLKDNLAKMANLQGAANNLDGDLQAEAQRQILAMEKVFEAQGYDIGEVREEVSKLLSDPSALQTLNTSKEPVINKKEEPEMPNDNRNYVDAKTFADGLVTTGQNIAKGSIIMSTQIARAMHEASKLGIELSDEKLDQFHDEIIKGLESNKQPAQVMDEFFGFSAVRAQKAEEQKNAELQAAREEGRREALKEAGVSLTRRDANKNPHPILDRKRIGEKIDSRVEKIEDLPKNQMGVPEYYRLRRYNRETRRMEHAANAADRYAEVSQIYDADGMNISNLQRGS